MKSIRNLTSIPIIVVDDGSQPDVQIESEITYVKLLKNNINHGKGYSLIKGFHYANDQGYTHAITLDADSQHDPAYIPEFLSIDENISIVCGKRDLKGSMPFHRRISNIITSKIVSFICHTKLFDSQCGYRRYNLQDVCRERYFEKGFQFETEILIKLLKNKLKIFHIDIPTIYAGESSSMRYIYDTLKFIRLIIRTLGEL
jgi:glycosyltransferase involved in cell wall biosynthesis